jgi:hypothetical protein
LQITTGIQPLKFETGGTKVDPGIAETTGVFGYAIFHNNKNKMAIYHL